MPMEFNRMLEALEQESFIQDNDATSSFPTQSSSLFQNNFAYQFFDHIAYPESAFVLACSLGNTLFFYFYTDASQHSIHLAGKFNFALIAISVVFPSMFMTLAAGQRRDLALNLIAKFRAQLYQTLIALLTWHGKFQMSREWEDQVLETCIAYSELLGEILLLPTLIVRHSVGERGLQFTKRVLRKREEKRLQLTRLTFEINTFVEDLKQRGLSPQESMMLFYFTMLLEKNVEHLMFLKFYRSSESGRVYVRVVLFICMMFYGPYFSFVAGNLCSDESIAIAACIPSDEQTNLAFALCLTFVTTLILLAIVAMQRNLEDVFREGRNSVHVTRAVSTTIRSLRDLHAQSRWKDRKRHFL